MDMPGFERHLQEERDAFGADHETRQASIISIPLLRIAYGVSTQGENLPSAGSSLGRSPRHRIRSRWATRPSRCAGCRRRCPHAADAELRRRKSRLGGQVMMVTEMTSSSETHANVGARERMGWARALDEGVGPAPEFGFCVTSNQRNENLGRTLRRSCGDLTHAHVGSLQSHDKSGDHPDT